jgi:TrmH family RNA methyltransferase
MITSPRNPKIQSIRGLQARSRARKREGAFVVEGVRLAEEALNAGWRPQLVLYTAELGPRGDAVVNAFREQDVDIILVTGQVMRAASDTQTPQGVLAVLPLQDQPTPDPLEFVLVPDGVRDPGNLGTMLRTAQAAGVQAVLIPPGTVDPYSPKVVRAAMGAHFRLSITPLAWEQIQGHLSHLNTYLADSSQGQPYYQADLRFPLALIIGGEADGASAAAQKIAQARVHIPMPGSAESLNAAIATGILLFEVARQRIRHHDG